MKSIYRLNLWAFQKFFSTMGESTFHQVILHEQPATTSYFINNCMTLTLVGFRGCWLWIIKWAMNILISAMNTSYDQSLISWSYSSTWIATQDWSRVSDFNQFVISWRCSFSDKGQALAVLLLCTYVQCRRQAGNMDSLPRAPSVRGPQIITQFVSHIPV